MGTFLLSIDESASASPTARSSLQFGSVLNWMALVVGTTPTDIMRRLGDNGCKWKRHPASRMLYGADLLEAGWNPSVRYARCQTGFITFVITTRLN